MEFREDGILRSTVLGFGQRGRDLEADIRPTLHGGKTLSTQELENLVSEPICQKVVAKIPDAALRGGMSLKIDENAADKKILREIRKTGIIKSLAQASKLARIYYRGAAVVLDVDDGQEDGSWMNPVNMNSVRSVKVAWVADGDRVYPSSRNVLGIMPKQFEAALAISGSDDFDGRDRIEENDLNKIHSSRVLWMPGIWTPPAIALRLDGELSLLSLFWEKYKRYEAAMSSAANLLHKSEILNMKRKGLNMMLASASVAEESSIKEEARNVRDLANNFGIVMSDAETDEFSVISRNLSHISGLLNDFRIDVVAASGGLSELDLFGLSTHTSGLNGDGIESRMISAATVDEFREMEWREPLEKFLELLFLAKEGPTKGKVPESWEIVWPSTLQLTQEEKIGLRLKQAQIDEIYVTKMGLPKELVLKARFGGAEWSDELELPENFKVEDPPAPAPPQQAGAPTAQPEET